MDIAADPGEHGRCDRAGHAIAAVDDNLGLVRPMRR
jgi:hypothetical protein